MLNNNVDIVSYGRTNWHVQCNIHPKNEKRADTILFTCYVRLQDPERVVYAMKGVNDSEPGIIYKVPCWNGSMVKPVLRRNGRSNRMRYSKRRVMVCVTSTQTHLSSKDGWIVGT